METATNPVVCSNATCVQDPSCLRGNEKGGWRYTRIYQHTKVYPGKVFSKTKPTKHWCLNHMVWQTLIPDMDFEISIVGIFSRWMWLSEQDTWKKIWINIGFQISIKSKHQKQYKAIKSSVTSRTIEVYQFCIGSSVANNMQNACRFTKQDLLIKHIIKNGKKPHFQWKK